MAISQQASGGTALDSVLSVYDASMTMLASDDDSGGGRNSLVKISVTAGQTYFVRAAGFGTLDGPVHSDACDRRSSATTSRHATPINLDQTGSGRVSGAIGWSGDTDVFQFSLSSPRAWRSRSKRKGARSTAFSPLYDSDQAN